MMSMYCGARQTPRAAGIFSIVMVLVLVEVLVRIGIINPYIIPLPSIVVHSFWRVLTVEHLLTRTLTTAAEALGAGLLIAVVGVPAGLLLAKARVVRDATENWIGALVATPVVLAYPLFMVVFGRSSLTIVMIAFFSGVWPVILKTLEGLAGVRPVLRNVGYSLKLSAWQLFWKIEFPAALPTIFTGLRLGLVFTLIVVVGVEFLINLGGLGQLINDLAERYDLPATYAAIFFVILVSVFFFRLLEKAEKWMGPGK